MERRMDLFYYVLKESVEHLEEVNYENLNIEEKRPIWQHVLEQLGNAIIFESAPDMDNNIN